LNDLNDLYFFSSVVLYNGFSAAARSIGVEKTRLSRRVAALERRLGVRLLQRSTRKLTLTEAGRRFYDQCLATVESAQAAYDGIAELQKEPGNGPNERPARAGSELFSADSSRLHGVLP
jgi:DNA-binding transcriptional LysR family regulator